MTKTQKIITSILSLVLCVLFVVSIADTCEFRKQTNFDQDKMMEHVENIAGNGTHSIFHPEANEAGIDYIVSVLDSYGLAGWAKERYFGQPARASDCIGCGVCETRCPYNLPIREMLKKAAAEIEA